MNEPGIALHDTREWIGLLRPMSLGGMFVLISAFGCIEKPYMPIHTGQSSRNNSPARWQAITLRAIQRLRELQSEVADERALSAVIAQSTLMRLLHAPGGSADQQIALNLLERLFRLRPDRRLLGLYPNMGQQRLF